LGAVVGAVALATSGPVVQAATFPITPTTLNPLTVGVPVSVQINANCPAGGMTTPTFSGALPAGLTVNINSGIISGTPTTAGPYTWTMNLTCPNGDFATITYSGSVLAAVPTMPPWMLFVLATSLFALAVRRLTASRSLRT
jgi:hypothetical protein